MQQKWTWTTPAWPSDLCLRCDTLRQIVNVGDTHEFSKQSWALYFSQPAKSRTLLTVILLRFVVSTVNTRIENDSSRGQLSLQDMKKVLRMEYEALQVLCTGAIWSYLELMRDGR